MINRPLQPLAFSGTSSIPLALECYALTYLAKYSNASIPTRVFTSFQRAFGMTTLEAFPRVDGGRPAYVVATWINGSLRRATVAIEGTTTLAQLVPLEGGLSVLSSLGSSGHVYAPFQTHASTINTELASNAAFLAVTSQVVAPLIFTGFSLGAAMAEYLGVARYVIGGQRPIAVYKFGSPRVGNRAWQAAASQNSNRATYYCQDDRIDLLPYISTSGAVAAAVTWNPSLISYQSDATPTRWDLQGNRYGDGLSHSLAAHFDAVLRLRADGDPPDPWINHDYDNYRFMLTSVARDQPLINYKRFAFVEFADDNSWGIRYPLARGVVAGTAFLAGTPPADEVVDVDATIEDALTAYYAGSPAANVAPMSPAPRQIVPPARPLGSWIPRRTRDFRSGNQ